MDFLFIDYLCIDNSFQKSSYSLKKENAYTRNSNIRKACHWSYQHPCMTQPATNAEARRECVINERARLLHSGGDRILM